MTNETFDAETKVDDLNAYELTRLSLEHGVIVNIAMVRSRLLLSS